METFNKEQILNKIEDLELQIADLKKSIKGKSDKIKYVRCIYSDSERYIKDKIYPVIEHTIRYGRHRIKIYNEYGNVPLIGNVWKFQPATKEEYEAQQRELEWPKGCDEYFYIDKYGDIEYDIWHNCTMDKERRDFLGIYKTEEEAEVVRDKIREFAQSLKK